MIEAILIGLSLAVWHKSGDNGGLSDGRRNLEMADRELAERSRRMRDCERVSKVIPFCSKASSDREND